LYFKYLFMNYYFKILVAYLLVFCVVSSAQAQMLPVKNTPNIYNSASLSVVNDNESDDTCFVPERILRRGMSGKDVELLQTLLSNNNPNLLPESSISGFFGPATEVALRDFQLKHGLVTSDIVLSSVPSVVGPKTIAYFKNTCKSKTDTISKTSSKLPLASQSIVNSSSSKPNIIFILADDLDLNVMNELTKIKNLMNDQGVTFLNHFVSLSLCCPSRTAILCGQYAHNNGVFTNSATNTDGTFGAYNGFMKRGNDQRTMAVSLHKAGYRTALMGKYLNGYTDKDGLSYSAIPSGWDEWIVPMHGDPYSEYGFTLNENGKKVSYALGPNSTDADKSEKYLTTVLEKKALDFIDKSASDTDPFFLYLATYAPHSPATPSPKYAALLSDPVWVAKHPLPKDASFNEADIEDKPIWMKNTPLLSRKQINKLGETYRRHVVSMYSVEDMIESIIEKLRETNQLDNTYIVFTSDNGYHFGQHRFTQGKLTEFDTDLHVPLIVRGPGVPAGETREQMTANIDFAPTFEELAGVNIPSYVDGRSFAPLLTGEGTYKKRTVFLLEHAAQDPVLVEPDSDAALEPLDDTLVSANAGADIFGKYIGIRHAKYTYILFPETGEQELYDNVADPAQINNIASTTIATRSKLMKKLRDWTIDLSTCKGSTCRSIEAEHRLAKQTN
jgi:arylsulfatase A-like enzyme